VGTATLRAFREELVKIAGFDLLEVFANNLEKLAESAPETRKRIQEYQKSRLKD
jgi:hypothetical protein